MCLEKGSKGQREEGINGCEYGWVKGGLMDEMEEQEGWGRENRDK